MKKRKKPIFLVAVLALIFVVVAGMNSSFLSTPQTPEEAEQQAAMDAAKQQQQQPQQVASTKPKKVDDSKPDSLVKPKGESDAADKMITGNVKPINAIDPKAPKLVAPIQLKNRVESPDRASTQANSGWYMPDSGAGK